MKKIYILLIALCISSCTSEIESFNTLAVQMVREDRVLDQQEYEKLIQYIQKSSDTEVFRVFKTDKASIDPEQVHNYLINLFKAKQLMISSENLWNPETYLTANTSFNINVFLENSASMDGYVSGVTQFESDIYSLLGNIKTADFCDTLNLGYVNNGIPYRKRNANLNDIQEFIEKLEPDNFKKRGGERGVSDIKQVLDIVLNQLDQHHAAILISDFVFSPGRDKDAREYMIHQSIGIKNSMTELLEKSDVSMVVLQMNSTFSGMYYTHTNTPVKLTGIKRPYYIWIIGSSPQIKKIIDSHYLEQIKGGYQHEWILNRPREDQKLNFKIQYAPRIGYFSAHGIKEGHLLEAASSREDRTKDLFKFHVAVDFSKSMQPTAFFNNPAHYKLSDPDYTLVIEPLENSSKQIKLSGYTHLLGLQTSHLRDEVLTINLIPELPAWIEEVSAETDRDILKDVAQQQRTLGFKYLAEGIYDAYYKHTEGRSLEQFEITIKQ